MRTANRLMVAALLTALITPTPVASAQAGVGTPARRVRTARRRIATPPPIPSLRLSVMPEAGRPFHVRVQLDVTRTGLTEAVADLRWLSFEIAAEGRRRPLTCAYSSVPTRTDITKVVHAPGAGSALLDAVVDLRMYCVGPAFDAVARGAEVRARYRIRSVNRTRYLVHDATPRVRPLTGVESAVFTLQPRAESEAAAVRVFVPSSVASRSVVLRPTLEARSSMRVYLRPDLWSFVIVTPDRQSVRCDVPRHPVVPIIDFFARLDPGSRRSATIDVSTLCPLIFHDPGVYDVTPVVDLVYGGDRLGFEALTGTFRGEPSFVRVRPPLDADPSEFVRPRP